LVRLKCPGSKENALRLPLAKLWPSTDCTRASWMAKIPQQGLIEASAQSDVPNSAPQECKTQSHKTHRSKATIALAAYLRQLG
jgi:hypothetical protein